MNWKSIKFEKKLKKELKLKKKFLVWKKIEEFENEYNETKKSKQKIKLNFELFKLNNILILSK